MALSRTHEEMIDAEAAAGDAAEIQADPVAQQLAGRPSTWQCQDAKCQKMNNAKDV